MNSKYLGSIRAVSMTVLLAVGLGLGGISSISHAAGGGGSGGGTVKVDSIKVSKCYAGFGEMLIKAASSDPTARLFAYLPSGVILGEVQNGGGSRYGGTVMGYVPVDPVMVLIVSTSGGSIIVPTTPFQL